MNSMVDKFLLARTISESMFEECNESPFYSDSKNLEQDFRAVFNSAGVCVINDSDAFRKCITTKVGRRAVIVVRKKEDGINVSLRTVGDFDYG